MIDTNIDRGCNPGGGLFGFGNDTCLWAIIIIIVLLCCCGGFGGFGGGGCR